MTRRLGIAVCLVLLFLLLGCTAPGSPEDAWTEADIQELEDRIILDTERSCAATLEDHCGNLYEDELSILYGYLDSPEDFSYDEVYEAIESIQRKTDDLAALIGKMERGEITVY